MAEHRRVDKLTTRRTFLSSIRFLSLFVLLARLFKLDIARNGARYTLRLCKP